MNHNEYKQLVQLSLYGELSREKQALLESHLRSCRECMAELENQKNLLALISDHKKFAVDDKLLNEARAQLRGAIRSEKELSNPIEKLSNKIVRFYSSAPRLAFSAVTILLAGILVGSLFFNKKGTVETTTKPVNNNYQAVLNDDVNISNIRFIDSDPSDGIIEFTFEAVKPVYLKGKVNDPGIQRILTYSMLNERNPGSRLNSINAMDSEQPETFDKEIRDALITVVMTDDNPGVRREALKLMKKFPYDESIKHAYLFVLTSDSSSALRIEALNSLIDAGKMGYTLSDSDLETFKQKIQKENNNYIRLKSAALLEEKY